MRIYYFSLAVAILLAGCASPRYQTAYRYEAPSDAAGRACLARCEPQLAVCKADCKIHYDACVKRVEPEIAVRFDEALKQYDFEYRRYQQDLLNFNWHYSFGWGYYGHGHGYGYGMFYPWHDPFFYQPSPPNPPSRERIHARVVQEKCSADCGCQSAYDGCFLSCGGKKIPETKCVANCPQGKP